MCWIPIDPTIDTEVTPSSSTNIRRIESKYTLKEIDRRRDLVDTFLEVDVDLIPAKAFMPTPTYGTSGIFAPSSFSHALVTFTTAQPT